MLGGPHGAADAARQHREGARRQRRARPAADCAALRGGLQGDHEPHVRRRRRRPGGAAISPGSQCHDITVYPALGLAGGACEGHGLLLDISDPVNPMRLDAVADSNFAYWHSATFNNDGTQDPLLRRMGRRRRAEVPRHRQAGVGRQRDLHDREPQAEVRELLQDPRRPDGERELRRAQRLADPDPGPRRDGAGVVSGRHLGVRLDRRGQSDGDRLLRPRPGGLHAHGDGRLVVGVLVQRRDRQLRDRPRTRRRRAGAEPVHLAERDRRGQDGEVGRT